MQIRSSTLDAIGNTPLIKLRRASEETGCTILGKAEFMNPGLSVKDRAALGIVTDAIDKGQLRPGGLIVEGTAGNTGIGLTVVGNALGMHTVIVIPETQSQEKKDTLRALGATVVEVPAAPYRSPNNYVKVAARMAERLALEHAHGAIFANQFDNVANRDIHVRTTGPEIWEQTAGTITHFVACLGTTGTFVGVGRYLKKMNQTVRLVGVQPDSPLHGLEGVKHLETSLVPGIWDPSLADETMFVATEDAQAATRRLARAEGILVGTSSGAAFDAALRLAERIREGVIVTVFSDAGANYLGERYWEEAP